MWVICVLCSSADDAIWALDVSQNWSEVDNLDANRFPFRKWKNLQENFSFKESFLVRKKENFSKQTFKTWVVESEAVEKKIVRVERKSTQLVVWIWKVTNNSSIGELKKKALLSPEIESENFDFSTSKKLQQ